MRWKFVVTDLDQKPIAEVHQAYERKFSAALSKPATATFSIKPDSPLLLPLYSEDTLLKIYHGSDLRFFGPIVSAQYATQEDGAQPSVAVSAVDPAWKLIKRLSGKSTTGTVYGTTDKGLIAQNEILLANAEGNTGIIASGGYEAGSSGAYTAGPYKPVLSCINELAHGVDGFDWLVNPVDGTEGALGEFYLDALIGEEKPNAIFEHGTGKKNIRSINYLRDLGGILNRAYHIPDEGLEGSEVVVGQSDSGSIAIRGIYEETVDLNGVTDTTLRQAWVDNQVAVRKEARRVLGMTSDVEDPTNPTHVPRPWIDYALGDLVPARAVVEDNILFDGQVRVHGINVELTNNGGARVTPILVEEA